MADVYVYDLDIADTISDDDYLLVNIGTGLKRIQKSVLKKYINELPEEKRGTLTAEGWVGEVVPYTQTVAILDMTAEASPIIDLVVSDAVETGVEEMKQWGHITKATTGEGNITFYCYENKPTIGLNFKVKAV